MTIQNAQQLIQRYLADGCTAEEEELLETWWAEIEGELPWTVPIEQEDEIHDRILSKIETTLERDDAR